MRARLPLGRSATIAGAGMPQAGQSRRGNRMWLVLDRDKAAVFMRYSFFLRAGLPLGLVVVWIMARIAALMASGRLGQASITPAKSCEM